MTKYAYDDVASERLQMDVVYEVDDRSGSLSEWLAARRRLNAIKDPLARRIIELHRDCGSGQVSATRASMIQRRWPIARTGAVRRHH